MGADEANITVREAIAAVVAGRDLDEDRAAAVAQAIMAGAASEAQIAGLLVALRMKGETVAEICGFVRAMRAAAMPIAVDADGVVDTCGTGGDGAGTFNISTAAAIVAAGAGCRVAKHGNRSASSKCGSADVLEALGVRIDLSPERSAALIGEVGIGFLFAPQYHKGARHAVGPRREIGVRTLFNTIGPLVHPGGARRQLMGVYDEGLTEPVAHVLQRMGSTHCLIVHGEDGLDELTTHGATRVSELRDGAVHTYSVMAEELGVPRNGDPGALAGGDAAHNATMICKVLDGETGPPRDIVLLNAGAVIYVGGKADSIAAGVQLAKQAIDSGRARGVLDALVQRSSEAAK